MKYKLTLAINTAKSLLGIKGSSIPGIFYPKYKNVYEEYKDLDVIKRLSKQLDRDIYNIYVGYMFANYLKSLSSSDKYIFTKKITNFYKVINKIFVLSVEEKVNLFKAKINAYGLNRNFVVPRDGVTVSVICKDEEFTNTCLDAVIAANIVFKANSDRIDNLIASLTGTMYSRVPLKFNYKNKSKLKSLNELKASQSTADFIYLDKYGSINIYAARYKEGGILIRCYIHVSEPFLYRKSSVELASIEKFVQSLLKA